MVSLEEAEERIRVVPHEKTTVYLVAASCVTSLRMSEKDEHGILMEAGSRSTTIGRKQNEINKKLPPSHSSFNNSLSSSSLAPLKRSLTAWTLSGSHSAGLRSTSSFHFSAVASASWIVDSSTEAITGAPRET